MVKKTGKINSKKLNKPVLCIETDIIYESVREASRQTGADYRHISKVCNGKYGYKSAGGYYWRWYYDD